MTIRRQANWVTLTATLCAATCACSNDDSPTAAKPDLPHFEDITSATPKIVAAARAVVRVHSAQAFGTGSFISSTGLLLTNNHVLGQPVCPIEGCYVEITQMHQRGQPPQDPLVALATPVAIDIGLDMAVLQLDDPTRSVPLSTPDYLTFDAVDSAALLDQHVTIVGHPEGNLKKWTDGVVVDATGKWFTTTAYALPGDSGSPILNDAGKIVGLMHRGPDSLDLVTDTGVNVYSVGTASAPIVAAMNAPLPSTMISKTGATTANGFLGNDFLYLNSRASSISINGTQVSALTVLGQACDSALARNDFASLDELYGALTPCYDAQAWIECRSDASAVPYGVVCPPPADATAWANRYLAANDLDVAMNGRADYYTVSGAIAHLQSSMAAGVTAGERSLQQVLDSTAPTLDLRLAYYLAAFGISSYAGTRISDYIVNYQRIPHYELQASYIAYAASWLVGNGAMERNDMVALAKKLMTDPDVDIGTKLSIEDFLYEIKQL
jgi:hypothetical protein